tara:strand:+ start:6487 stop:6969 length:483 start_codon:yes stop_codon:yes gene_type:complete
MTLNEPEAYKQGIQAYDTLTKKYKSPKDIPEKAWITGRDMEIGKWYLWVDGGHYSDFKEDEFLQQHIVMIPETIGMYRTRKQTIKDFDALWYLSDINDGKYQLYRKKENGVLGWAPKGKLTITLDSFGLVEGKKYVIGPLEYDFKSLFMNWDSNPLEVKE